jgi:hypothetical protein
VRLHLDTKVMPILHGTCTLQQNASASARHCTWRAAYRLKSLVAEPSRDEDRVDIEQTRKASQQAIDDCRSDERHVAAQIRVQSVEIGTRNSETPLTALRTH